MFAHTYTPSKSERRVTLLICFNGPWLEFSLVVEMPFWPEFIGIVTEYGTVVITLPYIGHACRAFRDEQTTIPIIFCGFVRHAEWYRGSPTKNLLDDGSYVRKVRSVRECRGMSATDDDIEFGLGSALHLREGHHGKRPPH